MTSYRLGVYWWEENSLYKEREEWHKVYNPDYKKDPEIRTENSNTSLNFAQSSDSNINSPVDPTSTVIE